jgi:hypothetical protein
MGGVVRPQPQRPGLSRSLVQRFIIERSISNGQYRTVNNWAVRKPAPLGEGRTILPHLVTVDGKRVGGWDYDPTVE